MVIKRLETQEEMMLNDKNESQLKNRAFNTIYALSVDSVGSPIPFTCSFDSNRSGFTVYLRTPTAPIAGLGGITGEYTCWYSFDIDIPCDGGSVRFEAHTKQLIIKAEMALYSGEMGVMARQLRWDRESPYSRTFGAAQGFQIETYGGEKKIVKVYNAEEWKSFNGIPPAASLDDAIETMLFHFRAFVAAASYYDDTKLLDGTEDTFMKMIEAELADDSTTHLWRIPQSKWDGYVESEIASKKRIREDCIKYGWDVPPAYGNLFMNNYMLPLYSYEDV